jgi:hypothetical protein
MRQFHFYRTDTGELHSKVFKCDSSTPYAEQDAKANAPMEHAHIETTHLKEHGVVEHWRWHVNTETKEILRKQ